ncbi:hypothetical protein CTAYLR_000595 [Chrysophaeum taylorii]|uniref:Calmodulin n=1 Tax=Chrysophaeum taylorii TaxID=2483200 RepID=A0AAD7XNJ6_9STRA|nr:hypothetical protein CTAYLR_000595 [Chrysophaeum taylorii]
MTTWESVARLWKDEEGSNFSRTALEEWFPADPSKKEQRAELWKGLDGNGNGYVSLAEYDGWFNARTLQAEKRRLKSSLFVYARPALVRAFDLANGVQKNSNDDYATKSEFGLLLLGTHAALRIYRIFELADESKDRRVSRDEFAHRLEDVNKELGENGNLVVDDFDSIDADASGSVLLDEAIAFFLAKICTNTKLLAEVPKKVKAAKKERAAPPQEKIVPQKSTPPSLKQTQKSTPPSLKQTPKSTPPSLKQTPVKAKVDTFFFEPPADVERPLQEDFDPPRALQQHDDDDDDYPLRLQYGGLEVLLRPTRTRGADVAPMDLNYHGVQVSLKPSSSSKSTKPSKTPRSAPSADLPAGWSRRYDQTRRRHYYVDHNTKTTTWRNPSANPLFVKSIG